MSKKFTASLMAASIVMMSVPIKEARSIEPVTALVALIGVGISASLAIKHKKHCEYLCTKTVCSNDVLNFSKQVIDAVFAASEKDSPRPRSIAEFCLKTCDNIGSLTFHTTGTSGEIHLDRIKLHQRFGDGWTIENCAKAYYANLRKKGEPIPQIRIDSEAFVYSQADLDHVRTFEANSNFSGYLVWAAEQKSLLITGESLQYSPSTAIKKKDPLTTGKNLHGSEAQLTKKIVPNVPK